MIQIYYYNVINYHSLFYVARTPTWRETKEAARRSSKTTPAAARKCSITAQRETVWPSGGLAIRRSDSLATQSDARRCALQHREYHDKLGQVLTHAFMMHWWNMKTIMSGRENAGRQREKVQAGRWDRWKLLSKQEGEGKIHSIICLLHANTHMSVAKPG